MQRREFLKTSLTVPVAFAALGSLEVFTTGCPSFQSVESEITGILQEVGPALQLITALLPLLTSKNIPTNVISGINTWTVKGQADLQQAITIIDQYKDNIKGNPTIQGQLNAAIQTTQQDVDQILNIAQVLDATTRTKIEDTVNVIGSAIISAENLIVQLEGKTSAMRTPRTVQGKLMVIKNKKDFKKELNSVFHAPTNDPVVDSATQKLSV